jgi:hypothetical protein
LSLPAKIVDVDPIDELLDSDSQGVASGVVPRAPQQSGAYEAAEDSESALGEAVTLAARAGRWDVVAKLAAARRRFKP